LFGHQKKSTTEARRKPGNLKRDFFVASKVQGLKPDHFWLFCGTAEARALIRTTVITGYKNRFPPPIGCVAQTNPVRTNKSQFKSAQQLSIPRLYSAGLKPTHFWTIYGTAEARALIRIALLLTIKTGFLHFCSGFCTPTRFCAAPTALVLFLCCPSAAALG
jgi:hypothetical protein